MTTTFVEPSARKRLIAAAKSRSYAPCSAVVAGVGESPVPRKSNAITRNPASSSVARYGSQPQTSPGGDSGASTTPTPPLPPRTAYSRCPSVVCSHSGATCTPCVPPHFLTTDSGLSSVLWSRVEPFAPQAVAAARAIARTATNRSEPSMSGPTRIVTTGSTRTATVNARCRLDQRTDKRPDPDRTGQDIRKNESTVLIATNALRRSRPVLPSPCRMSHGVRHDRAICSTSVKSGALATASDFA